MLNRDVCMVCIHGLAEEYTNELSSLWSKRYWMCPALTGKFIAIEQDPPKGCLKLMEQGVAAARVDNALP